MYEIYIGRVRVYHSLSTSDTEYEIADLLKLGIPANVFDVKFNGKNIIWYLHIDVEILRKEGVPCPI